MVFALPHRLPSFLPRDPSAAGAGSPLRPWLLAVALLLAILAGPSASAVEPPEPRIFANLVTDAFAEGDSDPAALGRLGNVTLFSAEADGYGRELWRTDGTRRGTFLVADLCPGTCSSSIQDFTPGIEQTVHFLQVRIASGDAELWRTDGTPAGTFRLAHLGEPRLEGFWIRPLGRYFFRATRPGTGSEPWVTDGTVAGTRLLVDLLPGSAGSQPFHFRATGSSASFVARSTNGLHELFRSNGTAHGTSRLTSPSGPPANDGLGITPLFWLDDRFLYLRQDGSGSDLWAWGPGLGERLLADWTRPGASAMLVSHGSDGERLLLLVEWPAGRQELWTSDGTVPGTTFLRDVTPPPHGVNPFLSAVAVDGRTVFFLATEASGREPWVTDGNPSGTHILADVCPGPCSSSEGMVVEVGGRVLFVGDDGSRTAPGAGREPWATDGTAAGTVRLGDLCPGPCSGAVLPPSPHGFLVAETPGGGNAVWRTDGTPAGTAEIAAFRFARVLSDSPEGALLGAWSFNGDGIEPWWTPGTPEGTASLGNLVTGRELGSDPVLLTRAETAAGERLFFVATGNGGERGLWASDGTVAGTAPVPGSPSLEGLPRHALRLEPGGGGAFLLVEDSDEHGNGLPSATLWWSDGSAPARQVASVPAPSSLAGLPLAADDQHLFLVAEGLWISDGTAAGTWRMLDDVAVADGTDQVALVDGVFHFVAGDDRAGGRAFSLWRSDGTAEGTAAWFRDPSWRTRFDIRELTPDGEGGLWFVASAGNDRDQLWRSDGTPAGTAVAVPLESGGQPRSLRPIPGAVPASLLFLGPSDFGSSSWWRSDGTPSGTRSLATAPLSPAADPRTSAAVVFQEELVFVGSDRGLYRTRTSGGDDQLLPLLAGFPPPSERRDPLDAALFTAAGRLWVVTRHAAQPWQLWMLEDLADGGVLLGEFPATSYGATDFTALGTGATAPVFFAAEAPESGVELWVIDLAAPPVQEPEVRCQPAADVLCLQDGRFRLRVEWRDPRSGNSGTGGAAPFPGSDRTGTFWFFDPANVELIVKMLDGRSLNGFFWTFYGGLSDVEYWIDVEDLESGWRRTYHNPPREICGRADTATFEDPEGVGPAPAPARAATAPSSSRRLAAAEVPDCAEDGILCLDGGRFRLEVTWRDPRSGDTGRGTAIPDATAPGTARTGYFWFFRDDNVELVAKVLDGTAVNGHHWVFWGALTDVEYDLRVVDVEAGVERMYHNPPGNVCGGADTTAF